MFDSARSRNERGNLFAVLDQTYAHALDHTGMRLLLFDFTLLENDAFCLRRSLKRIFLFLEFELSCAVVHVFPAEPLPISLEFSCSELPCHAMYLQRKY